jgi:hypothetical protein
MQPHSDATTHLETYSAPLALAVVEILREGGIPAWAQDPSGHRSGELAVRVPEGLRAEALAMVANRMEEIHGAAGAAPPTGEDDEASRPIILERFRRLGFLALLLAPLLVVTLASPRLPRPLALVVLVGGMVAILAWRNRQTDRG